ncbi:MAG: DUF1990 family protein [Chitinophagaceae bacterium]
MIIGFRDQKEHLDRYLELHKGKSVAVYKRDELVPKNTSIEFPFNWSLREFAESSFFDYSIFPSSILVGYGEWRKHSRNMQVGDTIVQQAYLPPGVIVSQKLIFGVRVNKVWKTEDEFGFGYEALEGHPELGESLFIVKCQGEKCIFTISTVSVPGNLISKMVAPFLTLPYQAFCTRKALEFVRNSFSNIS